MDTKSYKLDSMDKGWLLVDASDKTLGRLSTNIAKILMGKNKPEYTPHNDVGDYVVVINAEKIKVTGNKNEQKMYYRHTGYPGGIKMKTAENILSSNFPERVLKKAVERMMPSGPLANKQLKNLKIYSGSEHPHVSQKPELLDFKSMNDKNGKR